MIFRNDDITSNTKWDVMWEMYGLIKTLFPEADYWSCVTILCKDNDKGSVYEQVPFKGRDLKWFADVDSAYGINWVCPGRICSHGLFHLDHSKALRETQMLSIISSCNLLCTKTFVPPFNKYNEDTLDICRENNIEMVAKDGWKSLEHEKFDPTHDKWYFHSWRWTAKELRKALSGNSANVGQL